MVRVKIKHFEGPLDLLLQLIEQEKLDITKVSLAEVTEQYIEVINGDSREIPPHELADFLVVAAKLLLIKSKTLMPYLIWDDEEEEADLEHQLRMYREYLEASKKIHKMLLSKTFAFYREKFLAVGNIGFQPPPGITGGKLAYVFSEIIDGLTPLIDLPKAVIQRTINIQEKISHIRRIITERAKMSFTAFMKQAKDKTDVIVSFLALLELIKQKEIVVRQENIFEDMLIEKISHVPEITH